MTNPAVFTKVAQKEQRKMKRKLDADEITAEEFSTFLDIQLVLGHHNWKNYAKRFHK